jgi:hypothetical protein
MAAGESDLNEIQMGISIVKYPIDYHGAQSECSVVRFGLSIRKNIPIELGSDRSSRFAKLELFNQRLKDHW